MWLMVFLFGGIAIPAVLLLWYAIAMIEENRRQKTFKAADFWEAKR